MRRAELFRCCSVVQLSVWDSLEHASALSTLPEVQSLMDSLSKLGVTFEQPIVEFDSQIIPISARHAASSAAARPTVQNIAASKFSSAAGSAWPLNATQPLAPFAYERKAKKPERDVWFRAIERWRCLASCIFVSSPVLRSAVIMMTTDDLRARVLRSTLAT